MKHDASDDESEEENPEGDYTVYECPGLAPVSSSPLAENGVFFIESVFVRPECHEDLILAIFFSPSFT